MPNPLTFLKASKRKLGVVLIAGTLISGCGLGKDQALQCNTDPALGMTYPLGCVGDGRSGGSTRVFMGRLNYSSCVGGNESLSFSLSASTDAGTAAVLVASGTAVAAAYPGHVVEVDLQAKKI